MKRYLGLMLGIIFVLGSAATSFAIPAEIPSETQAVVAKGKTQITIGGEIRARGEYKNVDFDNDKSTDSSYDSRVRLSVDAKVTPNTEGFIQVEAGNGATADNYTWGNDSDGAKGIYNVGNAKRGQFNLLQGWILHTGSGLLGVPAGVKVGHMPLALGNKIFFAHDKFGDDAIVFFVDPIKELHIGLLTAKFRETRDIETGDLKITGDSDAYVGLFVYKGEGFNVSGDITFVDDKGFSADGLHFYNVGLRGNFALDPITIRVDGEKQFGSTGTTPDVDFTGYALLAGVDFKVNPDVTLTAEVAYGSGDDDPNDDEIGNFVTSLGADPHFTYIYEYRTKNACGIQFGGLCNTMYVKLGGSMKVTPDVTASLNAFWLKAVEDVALRGGTPDSDIGIEIDPKVVYKVDKNLKYWVEGGYLMAGDAWKDKAGNADDAYAIRHGIMLTF